MHDKEGNQIGYKFKMNNFPSKGTNHLRQEMEKARINIEWCRRHEYTRAQICIKNDLMD